MATISQNVQLNQLNNYLTTHHQKIATKINFIFSTSKLVCTFFFHFYSEKDTHFYGVHFSISSSFIFRRIEKYKSSFYTKEAPMYGHITISPSR